MHRFIISILLFTLIMIFWGCSKGSPVAAPASADYRVSYESLPVLVSDSDRTGAIKGGFGAIGLFQVFVDATNLSGEMIPLRSTLSTDVLEIVDITNFLTLSPCSDCVKLESIGLDTKSNLVLEIGIRHPFDAPNLEETASGTNRADLHVFNVEGTIIGESGQPFEFAGLGETIDSIRLLNADGYSKYLDQSLESIFPTTASIHPYILHFDDYTAGNFDPANPNGFTDVSAPSGNLVMAMGSDYDFKNYTFAYPTSGTLDFIFAVGCSFGLSVGSWMDRLEPEYRIPQFNKKAASEIDVRVTDWSFAAGDDQSTVTVEIDVMDINQGVTVGEGLDEMAQESSVSEIVIDIPGMLIEPLVISDPVPEGGMSQGRTDPYTFEVILTNTAAGMASAYPALIKVTDSYAAGSNANPLLVGMDGVARFDPGDNALDNLFAMDEFATYYAFILAEGGIEPICLITTDPSPPDVEQGTIITFDGSTSTDDGTIDSYEWDFDYDGATFDPESSGAVVNGYICVPGAYTVALRITDNELIESICTVDITILEDTGEIDGWSTDQLLIGSTSVEPFILNTSNRAIATWQNYLFIVMNSNLPEEASENIFFIRSTDMGLTWDTPIQVTKYPAEDNAWTREANLVVDENTGDIFVQFQSDWESFNTSGNYKFDVFFVMSSDQGKTFSNPVRVNDDTIGASNQYAGSIAVDDSVSPSRIYIAYENRAISNDLNIFVATALADDVANWTLTQIDDSTSKKSMHPSIFASDFDSSVNVAWVDPVNQGGTGKLLFDRSDDSGTTWSDDVGVFTVQSNNGPFETCLATVESTGIHGIIFRDVSSTNNTCTHRFVMSETPAGDTWGAPVNLTGGETQYCWAGTLDVSPDGKWVAVFEQDYNRENDWRALYSDSNDGITWTTPVQVDDQNSVFGLSMVLDRCSTVHVVWGDTRTDDLTNELYYDFGS
ncbi:MAG: PKD domain-containing protein [bacterium]